MLRKGATVLPFTSAAVQITLDNSIMKGKSIIQGLVYFQCDSPGTTVVLSFQVLMNCQSHLSRTSGKCIQEDIGCHFFYHSTTANDPETRAAKWNSAIIHFIMDICVKMWTTKISPVKTTVSVLPIHLINPSIYLKDLLLYPCPHHITPYSPTPA